MNLIKNKTPYKGKLKFKFEKYPHYSSKRNGVLNEIHLDLGFTKLVSRFVPDKTKNGFKVDHKKINLINKHTGGVIGTYKFKSNCSDCPDDDFLLHNSFMSNNGTYIGDIELGWWYYCNKLNVCDDYPHGVAEKTTFNEESGEIVNEYYGFTHRGGCFFKIGDRLFDENYEPNIDDYEEWEWYGYVDKYEESINKSKSEVDILSLEDKMNEGIKYIIPFNRRGKKQIETLDECKQAAINFSKYLS